METIAYHEAGHAFMAVYLGARVRCVTIEPADDDGPLRSGDTQVVWRVKALGEQEFRKRAVQVALAGPVAEMIYSGEPYHPGLVGEWAADWNDAWENASLLLVDERQRLAYLEDVSIRLYRLFERAENWAALGDLADNLLAHETLEADQVASIVRQWIG